MSSWVPLAEGTTGCDRVARAPLTPLVFSGGTTLADLVQEGVLFSHAPILCAFAAPHDPLADFLARRNDLNVGLYLSEKPFFTGLARHGAHWNHAILWAPAPQWPLVRDHLLACLFRCPGGIPIPVRMLAATIPDTLLLDRAALLPAQTRVACWLAGCHGLLAGVEASEPWQPYRVDVTR